MSLGNRIAEVALRGITGAYILNSGIGKLSLDEDHAKALQGMAATGIPPLAELDPKTFGTALAWSEIAIAGGLLAPFVPRRLAGLGLSAFAGGLLSMYFRNDKMTESDGIRPTPAGIPLSKDVWLAAIALALIAATGSGKGPKKVKRG